MVETESEPRALPPNPPSPHEILQNGVQAAGDLLCIENFEKLTPEQKAEILAICGVDEKDPNALMKAVAKVNEKILHVNNHLWSRGKRR